MTTRARRRTPGRQRVGPGAATAAGGVLAAGTSLLARIRPADRPLHPRGEVLPATITRLGSDPGCGVPWIDEAGSDPGLVRLSRALGLPSFLPDVHGLALRTPVSPDRHADLLFNTTGVGRFSRFLLLPTRTPRTRTLTTLLPYRSPTGPVLLAARPTRPGRYDLLWARPTGAWLRFAELVLAPGDGRDVALSFDPMTHPLPGLPAYDWARRLRRPAYASARRVRGEADPARPDVVAPTVRNSHPHPTHRRQAWRTGSR